MIRNNPVQPTPSYTPPTGIEGTSAPPSGTPVPDAPQGGAALGDQTEVGSYNREGADPELSAALGATLAGAEGLDASDVSTAEMGRFSTEGELPGEETSLTPEMQALADELGIPDLVDRIHRLGVNSENPELRNALLALRQMATGSPSERFTAMLRLVNNLNKIQTKAQDPSQDESYREINQLLGNTNLSELTEKGFTALENRLSNALNTPEQQAGASRAVNALRQMATDYTNDPDAGDRIGDLEKIAELIDGDAEFGTEHMSAIVNTLLDQRGNAGELIGGIIDMLPPETRAQVQEFVDRVQNRLQAAGGDALRTALRNPQHREAVMKLLNPAGEGAGKLNAIGDLLSGIGRESHAMFETVSNLLDDFGADKIAALFDDTKSVDQKISAFQDLVLHIKDKWPDIEVGQIIDKLKTSVSNVWNMSTEVVSQIRQGVSERLGRTPTDAPDTARPTETPDSPRTVDGDTPRTPDSPDTPRADGDTPRAADAPDADNPRAAGADAPDRATTAAAGQTDEAAEAGRPLSAMADELGISTQKLEEYKRALGDQFDRVMQFMREGGQRLRGEMAEMAMELFTSAKSAGSSVLGAIIDSPLSNQLADMLTSAKEMFSKVGINILEHMPKLATGLSRMLPAAGGVMSAIDTARFYNIAHNGEHNGRQYEDPNVRALALVASGLSAADTGLAVAEAFGVGLVGTAGNIGLAAASVALDIAIDHFDEHGMPESVGNIVRRGAALGTAAGALVPGAGWAMSAELMNIYGPDAIKDELIAMGEDGIELARNLLAQGGEAAQQAFEAVGDLAAEGVEWAGEQLLELSKETGELADAAKERARQLIRSGGQTAQRLLTYIDGNMNRAGAWARDLAQEGLQLGGNLTRAAGNILARTGNAGYQLMQEAYQNGSQAVRETLGGVFESAATNYQEAHRYVARLGEDGVEIFKSVIENSREMAGRAMTALGNMAETSITDLKNYILELGGNGSAAVRAAMSELAERARAGGQAAINALRDIGTRVSGLADDAINSLKSISSRANTAVIGAIQAIGTRFSSAADDAINALKDFRGSAVNAIRTIGSTVEGAGRQAAEALGDLWDSGVTQAGTALRSLSNSWSSGTASMRREGARILSDIERSVSNSAVGRTVRGWARSLGF